MLTFPRILARSLFIAVCAIFGDSLLSIGLTYFGSGFVEIIGDLMLIEVAVLFLVAALIEFSYSIGGTGFRKNVLGSKQGYSQSAHKEAGRKALALVFAGVFMFAVLIAVAVFIRS